MPAMGAGLTIGQLVDPTASRVSDVLADRWEIHFFDIVADMLAGPPPEYHQVKQTVGSQPIGAMY